MFFLYFETDPRAKHEWQQAWFGPHMQASINPWCTKSMWRCKVWKVLAYSLPILNVYYNPETKPEIWEFRLGVQMREGMQGRGEGANFLHEGRREHSGDDAKGGGVWV